MNNAQIRNKNHSLCVFDLCEVADLPTQFTLHAVDGALELDQLSVQEAGIVFVFGQL